MKLLLCLSMFILISKVVWANSEDHQLLKDALGHFKTIPNVNIDLKKNKDLISLGKKLYLETNLSVDKTVSCHTCHRLDNYGVDNKKTSLGVSGKQQKRNTPSTYNAVLNFVQGWDGKAQDLEQMTIIHLMDTSIFGQKDKDSLLKSIDKDKYLASFKKAFPKDKNPLNFSNIVNSIVGFQKTLLGPSRFDDFLKGQMNALSVLEKKGLSTFMSKGCVTCHNGVGFGGGTYMNLGLVEDYPTNDLGRYEITKIDSDKKNFKVPSLRNIEFTPPYLHDGSILTLNQMIKLMAKHQIGVQISENEVNEITAFLKSLSAKNNSESM